MKTNEEYRLLEQQLAERDAQLLKNADLLGEAADALDSMEKQNVLLRDAIIKNESCFSPCMDCMRVMREALAATDDLSGCILCDAEPYTYSTIWADGNATTTPLYKARTKS